MNLKSLTPARSLIALLAFSMIAVSFVAFIFLFSSGDSMSMRILCALMAFAACIRGSLHVLLLVPGTIGLVVAVALRTSLYLVTDSVILFAELVHVDVKADASLSSVCWRVSFDSTVSLANSRISAFVTSVNLSVTRSMRVSVDFVSCSLVCLLTFSITVEISSLVVRSSIIKASERIAFRVILFSAIPFHLEIWNSASASPLVVQVVSGVKASVALRKSRPWSAD